MKVGEWKAGQGCVWGVALLGIVGHLPVKYPRDEKMLMASPP